MTILQAPSPVTPADLKRAAYFGLKLPKPQTQPKPEPTPVQPARTMSDAEFRDWKRAEASKLAADAEPAPRKHPGRDAIRNRPTSGYRPTWEGDRFDPEPGDDAERLGFELAARGEDAIPPDGWSTYRLTRFYEGWIAGEKVSESRRAQVRQRVASNPARSGWGAFSPIRDEDVYKVGASS